MLISGRSHDFERIALTLFPRSHHVVKGAAGYPNKGRITLGQRVPPVGHRGVFRGLFLRLGSSVVSEGKTSALDGADTPEQANPVRTAGSVRSRESLLRLLQFFGAGTKTDGFCLQLLVYLSATLDAPKESGLMVAW